MIETRFVSSDKNKYVEVTINHEGSIIDCGFYDEQERRALAEHLQSVIDDLLYELDD